MRVAFSGTHRVGKTTLLEAVSAVVPAYDVVAEPYHLLQDEGHEFCDPPTVADFEHQLQRSIAVVSAARSDALIDRCPLDFVAYLRVLDEDFEPEPWMDAIERAMAALDLVVVVAIEGPDRIRLPAGEDARLRRAVDEQIRTLVLDDAFELGFATMEVDGDVNTRARQVLRALR